MFYSFNVEFSLIWSCKMGLWNKQNTYCLTIINYREKAINSLQVILQKFDVEVGDERTNELKELCDSFAQQREEFSNWQRNVCDPQIKL